MKFTVLIITLAALLVVGECSSNSQGPKRCCTAKQFEIGFGATIGQATDAGNIAIQQSFLGAFDFNDRKYGMDVYVRQFGGPWTHYKVIQLFSKGEMYVIADDEVCHKMPAGPEPRRCVPDAANYTNSFYFGNDAFLVDNWFSSGEPSAGFQGEMYTSTSSEDCTPVGATAVGVFVDAQGNKVQMIESAGYMNFTEGIKDPAHWFVPPPSCGNATWLAEDSSWQPIQDWKRMQATRMFL